MRYKYPSEESYVEQPVSSASITEDSLPKKQQLILQLFYLRSQDECSLRAPVFVNIREKTHQLVKTQCLTENQQYLSILTGIVISCNEFQE